MKKAITISGLGKQYTSGVRHSGSLRYWLGNKLQNRQAAKNLFWALKEVSLEIGQGEILGVIGRNGSGKSTLLKILSRITPPTTGQAVLNGRVASLLEVGTGFHPELTGRENIFLNGAILGMRRHEIKACFDEIIAFSGVGDFIDATVKTYSSGMYVRLAFSVAAHLRTDILLVDEILAVGDAEFQRKSLGKMNEVVQDSGRTILFVSHNLGLIQQLCTRVIGLEQGQVFVNDKPAIAINAYHQLITNQSKKTLNIRGTLCKEVAEIDIQLNGRPIQENPGCSLAEALDFTCTFIHHIKRPLKFHIALWRNGNRLCTLQDQDVFTKAQSPVRSRFKLDAGQFRPGHYTLSVGGLADHDTGDWFWVDEAATFTILEDWQSPNDPINYGWVNPRAFTVRS